MQPSVPRKQPRPTAFAETIKHHQIEWAQSARLSPDALEVRRGRTSWVLRSEYRTRNFFRLAWWQFIEGREHRWARTSELR